MAYRNRRTLVFQIRLVIQELCNQGLNSLPSTNVEFLYTISWFGASKLGLEVIKSSYSTQLSMKFFLLMNVKMPTVVGILTFMSRKTAFEAYLSLKTAEFLNIFIHIMSFKNFMLRWVSNLEARFKECTPKIQITESSCSPSLLAHVGTYELEYPHLVNTVCICSDRVLSYFLISIQLCSVQCILEINKLIEYCSHQWYFPTPPTRDGAFFANSVNSTCTTFHRYPIFSTRYSEMCKVYTGYCGTSEIEHGLCACTVDNPLAKARGLSHRTGAQPMLYLPLIIRDKLLPDFYPRQTTLILAFHFELICCRGKRQPI